MEWEVFDVELKVLHSEPFCNGVKEGENELINVWIVFKNYFLKI
jgi:hypothetical protein